MNLIGEKIIHNLIRQLTEEVKMFPIKWQFVKNNNLNNLIRIVALIISSLLLSLFIFACITADKEVSVISIRFLIVFIMTLLFCYIISPIIEFVIFIFSYLILFMIGIVLCMSIIPGSIYFYVRDGELLLPLLVSIDSIKPLYISIPICILSISVFFITIACSDTNNNIQRLEVKNEEKETW